MYTPIILKSLTLLLLYNSIILVPPVVLSVVFRDGEFLNFGLSLSFSFLAGTLLYRISGRHRLVVRRRDGFLIVSLLWVTIGVLGSLPFVIGVHLSLVDAVFESVSAFTTTGATIFARGIDGLPESILFYRQELQWFGGIGVIVSAIALFPVLGIGEPQLYQSEINGPDKKERIVPRIAVTAKRILHLYVFLTLACAFAFWFSGMSVFDAVAHSLSTISTGGFSTHDRSLGFYQSRQIELIAMLFMVLGSISFGLHYLARNAFSLRPYWHSTEVRIFFMLIAVSSVVVALFLYYHEPQHDLVDAFRRAAFTVVSIVTTTGFSIDDFSAWGAPVAMLIMYIGIIGGCAGSTSGGIKVIRFYILIKFSAREIFQLIHPRSLLPIKIDRRVIRPDILQAVMSFTSLYVATYVVFIILLLASGMDLLTAFGATTTCLNNLGPGLGQVSTDFSTASVFQKMLLSFAMLLGRLELFTLLVVFSPGYWRR